MMPLKHISKNKIYLQKGDFHFQESSIDNWPYWLFEENIKIVNEIIEEEERNRKHEEESSNASMPNVNDFTKGISNIGGNFGNIQVPKF